MARVAAVAASSTLAETFWCTTSSSCLTPVLIWWIAEVCSCEAAAISRISSEVRRIAGTISPSSRPAFSATDTLRPASSPIWCAAS